MELEFHQLELRYDRLRIARPEQERRLLSSLAEVGQQVPIVVVKDDQHFVQARAFVAPSRSRHRWRPVLGVQRIRSPSGEPLVAHR